MSRRKAFTLLELVVSLASSVMLVGGLAGSLYIANQALSGSVNARQSLAASTVLRDMMAEVSQAKAFIERTPHAITFTVPDRNGDAAPDVIRYAWSGTPGDPLTYEYNGSGAVEVATDVQAFQLTGLTRVLTTPTISAPVVQGVVFEEFTERPVANTAQVVIDKPAGTEEGDLLIACVATDGGTDISRPDSSWNLIHHGWNNGANNFSTTVTFGVWWKIAGSTEASNYQFNRSKTSENAYGWIMRFTGHHLTNPIHAVNSSAGATPILGPHTPLSPAVNSTVPNTLILRLGGFDSIRIAPSNPGLATPSPHNRIIVNYSGASAMLDCSGAAGYLTQSTAGSSGASNFELTAREEFVTVTIAIAPDTSE